MRVPAGSLFAFALQLRVTAKDLSLIVRLVSEDWLEAIRSKI